jgi:hypothetical protein
MTIRFVGIGINNYANAPLRGCVPDVDAFSKRLYKRGLPWKSMRTVTDQTTKRATRLGMFRRVEHMCRNAQPGDRLILLYSGHGAQIPLRASGEVDGMIEVLCPVDFDWDNKATWFRDTDLSSVLAKLPDGVDCTVILDSCSSGGMSDLGGRPRSINSPEAQPSLPKAYPVEQNLDTRIRLGAVEELAIRPNRFIKTAATPNAVYLCACQEYQTSADAWFSDVSGYRGAFTHHLLRALEKPTLSRREAVMVAAESLRQDGFKQEPMVLGNEDLARLPLML